MPPSVIAILILGLLFVLLAGGMPLGFAMGLSGFLGTLLLIDGGASLALLGQTAYETGARLQSFGHPDVRADGLHRGRGGAQRVAL